MFGAPVYIARSVPDAPPVQCPKSVRKCPKGQKRVLKSLPTKSFRVIGTAQRKLGAGLKAARAAKAGKRSRTLLSRETLSPVRCPPVYICVPNESGHEDDHDDKDDDEEEEFHVPLHACPMPICLPLGDGCKYIADATKTKNGCLKYPCGRKECKATNFKIVGETVYCQIANVVKRCLTFFATSKCSTSTLKVVYYLSFEFMFIVDVTFICTTIRSY